MLKLDLYNDDDSLKHKMMLPPIMSVCTIQSPPLPQSTVDCFMSVSNTTHSIRVLSISSINLGKNLPVTPVLTKITKCPFSFLELPLGLIPEDLDIIPFSGWKRTIVRNNVTSRNASYKLI
jgi:hypothetical protein